ncbi:MAG: AIR synthase-related protein, partial [bacterium]
GIVHITGGGLHGNLRNAIPQELSFELRYDNIPKNPIFKLIQESGDISDDEMFNTFNMGVGIVYILPESEFDNAYEYLLNKGSMPIDLGKISGG